MGFYISQYLFSGFIIKQIGIKSVLFFSLREGSVEYSKDNYKMLQSICLKGKCIKKVCSHNLYEHTFCMNTPFYILNNHVPQKVR